LFFVLPIPSDALLTSANRMFRVGLRDKNVFAAPLQKKLREMKELKFMAPSDVSVFGYE
jgi:hypothetical protein